MKLQQIQKPHLMPTLNPDSLYSISFSPLAEVPRLLEFEAQFSKARPDSLGLGIPRWDLEVSSQDHRARRISDILKIY